MKQLINIYYPLYTITSDINRDITLSRDDINVLTELLESLNSLLQLDGVIAEISIDNRQIHFVLEFAKRRKLTNILESIDELSLQLSEGLGYIGFDLPDQTRPVFVDTDTYVIDPPIDIEESDSSNGDSSEEVDIVIPSPKAKEKNKKKKRKPVDRASSPAGVQITINARDERTSTYYPIQITSDSTVEDLKEQVSKIIKTPTKQISLYYLISPILAEQIGIGDSDDDNTIKYPDGRIGILLVKSNNKLYDYHMKQPMAFISIRTKKVK